MPDPIKASTHFPAPPVSGGGGDLRELDSIVVQSAIIKATITRRQPLNGSGNR
jgi:hypothetical protein